MTEVLTALGLGTYGKLLILLREKGIREYYAYPNGSPAVRDGFYYAPDDRDSSEGVLYVWTKGKRVCFNFQDDKLVNILVPTTSPVYC